VATASACGGPSDQFDFWLGNWNFNSAGAARGTNDITKEDQCLVEEHFRDSNGAQGRSVSLWSRLDGQWHQTYIDSANNRLPLVGRLEGDRMVLNLNGGERYLWQETDAQTVRYWGERSSDAGATWTVFFDSNYTRR
jgi:hypothetical protein